MKSIYLVLDMQNDLIHADGASGKAPMQAEVQSRAIISRTTKAIASARAAGIPVAFVRVAFSDDHREANPDSQVFGPIAKNGILKMNAWGGQVHEALAPLAGEWDIVKHRVSPFYQTRLELLLKKEGIERIYCSGVSTAAVVQATVRDGHDRDFDMVLLQDCCAAHSDEEHRNSVASIGRFCQVVDSTEAFS
tara:strand:- start:3474 stop:4049 length:576 start_codon:yes stop_codon:yes gene_type:complete